MENFTYDDEFHFGRYLLVYKELLSVHDSVGILVQCTMYL